MHDITPQDKVIVDAYSERGLGEAFSYTHRFDDVCIDDELTIEMYEKGHIFLIKTLTGN